MAKDTYYFQHDFEPTSDPKMQALVKEYDWAGYGLFWRIIEMMHSDSTHRLPLKKFLFISLTNKSTGVEQVSDFVQRCIEDFELFKSDGEYFWSDRVFRNIEKRTESKENKSKAGKASAEARRLRSTGVQQRSTDDEQNPTKERKGKERKGNNTNTELFLKELVLPYNSNKFIETWSTLKNTKKWRKKESSALQMSLNKLSKVSEQDAIQMMENCIGGEWQGLVDLKIPSNNAFKNQEQADKPEFSRIKAD